MTYFIQWKKTIDAKFRAAYLAKTGEKIQDNPMESEDGLSYMIGSSRVSENQLDELKVDVEINTNKNTPPVNWVFKQTK